MSAPNHPMDHGNQTSLAHINFFLQLIFVLYSNHICYTFIIKLLSLNNDSFAKQIHSSIEETTIFAHLLPMQRQYSCVKSQLCFSYYFSESALSTTTLCKTGNNIIELFYSSVRILEENRRAANHNGSFIHISNCFIQPSLNGGYKSIRELPIDIYPNIKVTPQYHK